MKERAEEIRKLVEKQAQLREISSPAELARRIAVAEECLRNYHSTAAAFQKANVELDEANARLRESDFDAPVELGRIEAQLTKMDTQ